MICSICGRFIVNDELNCHIIYCEDALKRTMNHDKIPQKAVEPEKIAKNEDLYYNINSFEEFNDRNENIKDDDYLEKISDEEYQISHSHEEMKEQKEKVIKGANLEGKKEEQLPKALNSFICINCDMCFTDETIYEYHIVNCALLDNVEWNDTTTQIINESVHVPLNRLNRSEIPVDGLIVDIDQVESAESSPFEYKDGMDYEELLRLDENVKNPLDPLSISMLPVNKMKASELARLNEDNKKCLICMEDFKVNDEVTILPCIHYFHYDHSLKWFRSNKNCPSCRTEINLK